MIASPTLTDGPVVGSRRRTATLRARVSIARRLWDLEEITEILNRGTIDGKRPRYSVEAVRAWIVTGELPAIALPSAWAADRARPGWRTYRVPEVWVADWFAMRDKGRPRFTAREDIGDDLDPPWLTTNDAGLAIGVSHTTMDEFVRLGIVSASTDPSGAQVVSTRTLDDWVYRMISMAEEEWYGAERREVVG